MFVRNRTSFSPVLTRSALHSDVSLLSVSAELVYAHRNGELELSDAPRLETDPPDIRRELLWKGCSATAFGHAACPPQPPYVTPVRFRVGKVERRIVVFGPRRWERRGRQLVPSEVERFGALPMSWGLAYGGRRCAQPGFLPGTDLPYPGGEIPHPLNPDGQGWWLAAADAEGQFLPSIEDPSCLLRVFGQEVQPAGIAPCPKLAALRLSTLDPASREDDPQAQLDALLFAAHHAPPQLIVACPDPGVQVRLRGLGAELAFLLPPPPIAIAARTGRTLDSLAPKLRSIHVDADARRVRLVWAFRHRYAPDTPPSWIVAEAA